MSINEKNISVKVFLQTILNNFKNSKNFFYKDNRLKYTYKDCYKKICIFVNFINNIKHKKLLVLSDKSLNYYLVVISIILSGKTWIQVSPNIPINRIKNIIKVSGSNIAFYDESFNNPDIKKKLRLTFFDTIDIQNRFKFEKIKKVKKINPKNIAMIFFTSGSTAIPKGVKITYSSFIYSAYQQIKKLNYKKNKEIFSDYHDSSFVMSLNVIFPAIYLSSTIAPITSYEDKINPIEHINKNKISVLITVPSFFLYINNFIKKKISINNLIFCGENLPLNIFKIALNKIKFKTLHNCYGSTELSPWVFYYKYSDSHKSIIEKFNQVPIGRPFDHTKYILNKKNELCIAGPALSNGYLQKSQNKNKFFSLKNITYYNTGDICKNHEKNFMFVLGRNDKQVKVRGYRINLLEIESVVKKIPSVEFIMCFKKKNQDKLAMLVVSKSKNIENKINEFLIKNLPIYMIPNEIVIKKKIKLNKNGKVDRNFYINNLNGLKS